MLRTKSVPLRIKAAGEHEGTEEGVVEAVVATYDKDAVGDKILPGAFKDTLAEWAASEDPIPFIWSHDWGNPDAHIGVIEDAKETDAGLHVKARLDITDPFAAKVYKLLKGRRVKQFSFGYEVQDGAFVDAKAADGDDGPEDAYYELRKLRLFEAGPCLVGANQSTSLEAVKSAPGVSEGRVRELIAETRTKADGDGPGEEPEDAAPLSDAEIAAVRALLADRDTGKSAEPQDEKATPAQPADDEDPDGVKSVQPARSGTAALTAAQLQLMELSIFGETV